MRWYEQILFHGNGGGKGSHVFLIMGRCHEVIVWMNEELRGHGVWMDREERRRGEKEPREPDEPSEPVRQHTNTKSQNKQEGRWFSIFVTSWSLALASRA